MINFASDGGKVPQKGPQFSSWAKKHHSLPKPLTPRDRQQLIEERELILDRLNTIETLERFLSCMDPHVTLADHLARCHRRDFPRKGAKSV